MWFLWAQYPVCHWRWRSWVQREDIYLDLLFSVSISNTAVRALHAESYVYLETDASEVPFSKIH